jgi:hypothetical protein
VRQSYGFDTPDSPPAPREVSLAAFLSFALGCLAFLTALLWFLTWNPVAARLLGLTTITLAIMTITIWFMSPTRTRLGKIGLSLALIACLPILLVLYNYIG